MRDSKKHSDTHFAHAPYAGECEVPLEEPCYPFLAIVLDDEIQAEHHGGTDLLWTLAGRNWEVDREGRTIGKR